MVEPWSRLTFKSRTRFVKQNCLIRDMDAEHVVRRLKIDFNFWNMQKMLTIKTLLILVLRVTSLLAPNLLLDCIW
jgi:hypothetical protein